MLTVSHFDPDMLTIEYKTCRTNLSDIMFTIQRTIALIYCISSWTAEVLSVIVDDLKARVNAALNRQVQLWKESDREYKNTVAAGDADKQNGIENCFCHMAREPVFECMIYIWFVEVAVPSGMAAFNVLLTWLIHQ